VPLHFRFECKCKTWKPRISLYYSRLPLHSHCPDIVLCISLLFCNAPFFLDLHWQVYGAWEFVVPNGAFLLRECPPICLDMLACRAFRLNGSLLPSAFAMASTAGT